MPSTTCTRCGRTLSTADPDGPPVFCMFCGQKLRDHDTTTPSPQPLLPDGMRTTSFVPFGPDPDAVSEPAPKEVGGYRLIRMLGAGGMGTVYEADAPAGGRVAIKLLASRLASNPSSVERFRQEGRLASQLSHPRCVFVLAADADGGRPYIVMELMPGRTLRDVVDQSGPLPPERAIAYILDVIDGLAEAHRFGVLHRDVKPSNCFLTADDRVKVGDFGLSKSLTGSQDRHLTTSGAFLGTVLFASPEQIRGEPLDYASDVYSVCATLYYLLCGEAPYQHESVTAALAKAISEPPPPIRTKRPEVPAALEKVVMAGLERDRDRRWESLDELHDALAAVLPSRQVPARPRVLVGAYILDRIVLSFLTAPAELARQLIAHPDADIHLDVSELRWPAALILLAYFAVGDGVYGATLGKWLLGLRVSRLGQTGPPGVWVALARTLVFHAVLVGLVFLIPGLLVEWLGAAGGFIGFGSLLIGAVLLLSQFRRTAGGYRGVHDFATGCHVTQRPLPVRKLRLVSRRPNPLDQFLPVTEPLPEVVGGYVVRGRLSEGESGEQVWAAEDRALGRRVLLWLWPDDRGVAPLPAEVSRPTRLRRLGTGYLTWAGRGYDWTVFAAPVGVPLADTIHPGRPLSWADARFLLEQLTDEFRTAEADGSMPERLGLNQVWVEPNGRVQLLDFPLSPPSFAGKGAGGLGSGDPTPNPLPRRERGLQQGGGFGSSDSTPLGLLRQVASLTLEGVPRIAGGPIWAPVPPHAMPVLARLFTPGEYANPTDLHHDLAVTHSHQPEVTPAVRAAQLGIQAAFLALGLVVMFVFTGGFAIALALMAGERVDAVDATLARLADPAARDELAKITDAGPALKNLKTTTERLQGLRDRTKAEADARRAALIAPQRFIIRSIDEDNPPAEQEAVSPQTVRELLVWAGARPASTAGRAPGPRREDRYALLILLVFPLLWVIAAVVFRGGLSMILTGLAVVRADGRKAGRWQCAVRAVVVWLPVTLLLLASAWLQYVAYQHPYLYVALWLLAVALLPVYLVVALRYPDRPPQDRVAGTYLVPA